jgi:hypothetical protein
VDFLIDKAPPAHHTPKERKFLHDPAPAGRVLLCTLRGASPGLAAPDTRGLGASPLPGDIPMVFQHSLRRQGSLPGIIRLAMVAILFGCGSGDPPGPNAVVDGDSLTPGDTPTNPDTPPPPPGPVPAPDTLPSPGPDTLPTPTDTLLPPDTLPTPDTLPRPDTIPHLDTLPDPDTLPPPNYSGIPFGPFGLWEPNRSIDARLRPFTGSHNYTHPDSIVRQIRIARLKHHRLILNMTGGESDRYTTNGKFDLDKWKARMDRFNTPEIRRAVAAAVADGTVIGNSVIDEPETRQWGDVITKQMLDNMGSYVKAIFPTLPVGVDHGPPAHEWRASERYHVLDYVIYQYAWWVTTGDVAKWRDEVRSLAKRDGVALGFSLNIVNGGVQDRKDWACRGTWHGSRYPNCQVTSDQLRDWIETFGTETCMVLLWRYHEDFISRPANQEVLQQLASKLGQAPKRSCRRTE